jgi:hypothetical protein
MRTTLTLDDSLARELRTLAHQTDRSFKQVVNETLRQGLARGAEPAEPLPPFRVEPKACGFRPGVDVYGLNRLNDEIEIDDFRREVSQRARDEAR